MEKREPGRPPLKDFLDAVSPELKAAMAAGVSVNSDIAPLLDEEGLRKTRREIVAFYRPQAVAKKQGAQKERVARITAIIKEKNWFHRSCSAIANDLKKMTCPKGKAVFKEKTDTLRKDVAATRR